MAAIPPPACPTVTAIYAAYEAAADTGYRAHLGASLIGTECERAIWYSFRWATRAQHTGRLLRLFDTGNLAEARFVADLRRIGVTVLDLDPATGRQWNLRDASGHFGGSMDAVAIGLPEAPATWHVCEFKTHSAKSFTKLKAEGVAASKPLHWAQMQAYMQLAGLDRAFYLAVGKDTDELTRSAFARCRGRAAHLGQGKRHHWRGPAAGPHQPGPGLVAVPLLRSPRALPCRCGPGAALPVLPACVSRAGWRLALRSACGTARTPRPGGGVRSASLPARLRGSRAARRRRGLGQLSAPRWHHMA